MSTSTPQYQTAAWIDRPGPATKPSLRHDISIPTPGPGEVLVKVEYSGVCHSDVHAILGETKRMAVHIGGHEGIGRIVALGPTAPSLPSVPGNHSTERDHSEQLELNTRVGVQWLASACLSCEICSINYAHCPNQHNNGRDIPGTFQQYVVASARFVTRIPDGLASEKAAPLLCAGLTIYGAIKKAGLQKGEWMVVLGAGGGLGHLGVQIARARGFKVIAIDEGEGKRELCERLLGSREGGVFLDYEKEDVEKEVKALTNGYGAHGVVCPTGNDEAYVQAFKLVRRLGTVVCVGLTVGILPVSPFEVAIKGLKVLGTTVGTKEEMDELLEMAVKGDVVPNIEVFELEELAAVLERLNNAEIVGRAVMKIPA